jgi:hypothetical protein
MEYDIKVGALAELSFMFKTNNTEGTDAALIEVHSYLLSLWMVELIPEMHGRNIT